LSTPNHRMIRTACLYQVGELLPSRVPRRRLSVFIRAERRQTVLWSTSRVAVQGTTWSLSWWSGADSTPRLLPGAPRLCQGNGNSPMDAPLVLVVASLLIPSH